MMNGQLEERKICGLKCLCREAPEKGKSPGILFLHGAGTRGSIDALRNHAFFHETLPQLEHFAILAPFLEGNTWFDAAERLIALSKRAAEEISCDPDRLSLMGTSMGGVGAWQLAMACPECFCALVPLCGGGPEWNAGRLIHVPVWAFHGALDTLVTPDHSRRMVEAVNQKGGSARLTEYPDLQHNCWSRAFGTEELYAWLESRRRDAAPGPKDTEHRGSAFG